jgi:hypothetical protein
MSDVAEVLEGRELRTGATPSRAFFISDAPKSLER